MGTQLHDHIGKWFISDVLSTGGEFREALEKAGVFSLGSEVQKLLDPFVSSIGQYPKTGLEIVADYVHAIITSAAPSDWGPTFPTMKNNTPLFPILLDCLGVTEEVKQTALAVYATIDSNYRK